MSRLTVTIERANTQDLSTDLLPWVPQPGERVRSRKDGVLGTVEDTDYGATKIRFDDGVFGIFRLEDVPREIAIATEQALVAAHGEGE